MTTKQIIEQGKRYILPTYAQLPVVFTGGEGCMIYDADGREYLDFVAGIAVNALGCGDDELKQALHDVLDRGLTHCSNLYWNEPAVTAAALLAELSGLEQTFFCNSGAEANEAALKLARKFASRTSQETSANWVITMQQSFHGRTYGAITATGQEKYHKGFAPMMPGFRYAVFNDLSSVEMLIDDECCAVMVEPIQGEGGIIPAEQEFLQGLRDLCDRNNLLLIFDEVQCGIGRTGHPFAFQHYGVTPDVITLAKGLGAGVPIGAMTVGGKAAGILQPGDHASTFGGNLLSCTAAEVVLKRLGMKGFLDAVKAKGETLRGLLEQLKKEQDVITDVRGVGLMQGIALNIPAGEVTKACMEHGLLLVAAGPQVVRFVPPLTVSEEEIHRAVDILGSVLRQLAQVQR